MTEIKAKAEEKHGVDKVFHRQGQAETCDGDDNRHAGGGAGKSHKLGNGAHAQGRGRDDARRSAVAWTGQQSEQPQGRHQQALAETPPDQSPAQAPLGPKEQDPRPQLFALHRLGDLGVGHLLEAAQRQDVAVRQIQPGHRVHGRLAELPAHRVAQAVLVVLDRGTPTAAGGSGPRTRPPGPAPGRGNNAARRPGRSGRANPRTARGTPVP